MIEIDKNRLNASAEIFKALGHPARLLIVMALSEKVCCVCELQKLIGSDISTVSKHLTVLRSVGLVSSDKRGKNVYYSLRISCALSFIKCVNGALCERGY